MKVPSFINRANILALIGIFGTVFGVYTYYASQKEREPTFFDDPYKVSIVSTELVKETPIKIFRSNGVELNGNIYSTKFYFFNQGDLPIRRDEILEPIRVGIKDSLAEILDFKILKTSRDVIKLQLVNDTIHKNILNLDFRILKKMMVVLLK